MSGDARGDHFRGALLGVAVGDALGAPYEGSAPRDPERLSSWAGRVPFALRYTDDTHMTLGTARSLIERGGRFDGEHMAHVFAAAYRNEPWRGYGPGPPKIFALIEQGEPWDRAASELFDGDGSFGNGAAMRAAPIGLLHCHDLERADEVARAAARITHDHPLGIDGAAVQACAVALLASMDGAAAAAFDRGAFFAGLRAHARTQVFTRVLESAERLAPDAPPRQVIDELGHGIEAHRSVPTAIYSFLRTPHSFAEAVCFAVALGGDSDTIASMTGALSGAFLGAAAIPAPWRDGVENASLLCDLADELCRLADEPAPA